MLDKETQKKIASCKALQGKTIEDIVFSERYKYNLSVYMTAQREDRNAIKKSYAAMKKLGGAKGYKLPAHPVDRVINQSVGEFIADFVEVISKRSVRPVAERNYIKQLGMQAYNFTIAQVVCEEYPELEPVLLLKPENAN